jgi:hypothetical protein
VPGSGSISGEHPGAPPGYALDGTLDERAEGLDVARDPAFKEEVAQQLGRRHRQGE